MQKTSIEWTDLSANPIKARHRVTRNVGHHCVKISPGCANCYSAAWNGWRGNRLPFTRGGGEQAEMFLDEKVLASLLRHRKPCRVFLGDMTDIFGEWVPDEWLDRIFAAMALCPKLTFQVLTKRPERMRDYLKQIGDDRDRQRWAMGACDLLGTPDALTVFDDLEWPLRNVWLGTSVEDQQRADERIPHLLGTPAAVRFLSVEPLLGSVDLVPWLGGRTFRCPCGFHRTENELVFSGGDRYSCPNCHRRCDILAAIDWVIVGGESGPKARPCQLGWVRSIVEQCKAAGVPAFVKQMGAVPITDDPARDSRLGDHAPACKTIPGYYGCCMLHGKGGDWSEWPADLRVREFPAVHREAAAS